MPESTSRPTPRWLGALLWVLAVLLMLAAVIYQRRTGPTYPHRGEVTLADTTLQHELVRSHETTAPARVELPDPGPATSAELTYRRFPTDDPFTTVPMEHGTDEDGKPVLFATLPVQPAAGKVEYSVTLRAGDEALVIPAPGVPRTSEEGHLILRYKDPVPLPLLLSHVLLMFFSVLIGMRTGLAALFAPSNMRTLAWSTFCGMTLGGMVLGPFVQKHAFGEYWTGFPWGYDLTDNKMLIMWLVWLIACSTVGFRPRRKEGIGRAAVVVAALVMTGVYLIPHSMRGSELDYEQVDQGVPAGEAVGTGD